MNKEEKRAIRYINKDLKKADMLEMTVHTDNESVRTVLNLIKKQRKIISKLINILLEKTDYCINQNKNCTYKQIGNCRECIKDSINWRS